MTTMTTIPDGQQALFIYSPTVYQEKVRVGNDTGRKYEYGTVVDGTARRKYTDIIHPDDLSAAMDRYPDTTVVFTGDKNTVFTPQGFVKL